MEPILAPRSLLFVPGDQPRRIDKALASAADAVIIDLEDAVPREGKDAARAAAAGALGRRQGVFVRVNGFDDPACLDDLEALIRPGLAGIVLPKAESAGQLATLDWVIGRLEARRGLQAGTVELLPLVETARGVEALPALARAQRVRRLSFGVADYSLDLGLQPDANEDSLAYIRARLVHCSRAAGLDPPLDSVVVEVRDLERFRDSAQRARRLGLAGKLCIHPDQVPVANEVFSPTASEVERALAVLAAWDGAQKRGEAVATAGGEFIDAPVVARARRVLSLQRA